MVEILRVETIPQALFLLVFAKFDLGMLFNPPLQSESTLAINGLNLMNLLQSIFTLSKVL